MTESLLFAPRRSWGWLWLIGIGLLVLVPTVGLNFLVPDLPGSVVAINYAVGLPIGVPILLLAAWFPTMRYELDDQALTLRYGPVCSYRIPLSSIQTVLHRDLAISLWSSFRLPGFALFGVPYADRGVVNMCATACCQGILLIETPSKTYGMTPADEPAFVQALNERLASIEISEATS